LILSFIKRFNILERDVLVDDLILVVEENHGESSVTRNLLLVFDERVKASYGLIPDVAHRPRTVKHKDDAGELWLSWLELNLYV
jgi:hypothetical protein